VIADAFASISFSGVHPRDPAVLRMLGVDRATTSGAEVNAKSVVGYAPIWRGVNLIGNAVAKCKPFIYRRMEGSERDKERAMDHPAWRATVRQANQWMSAGEFRKTVTSYALLWGNGIAHVERDGAGNVIEYLPLLPDRTGMAVFNTNITEDSEFPESGEVMYWTLVGGKVRTILPENILHIRGLSFNGVWGLSVIEVLRETLGLGIAIRESGARFFGQGMMSSGILYMPPGMQDEQVQETFARGIKEQIQGLGRSHKLVVVEEGAKLEKLSVDPNMAQALESREFSAREAALVIGCQPHKLGDTKRTSYASLEQANQEHLDDDIDPWLARWEEALESVALSEKEKDSGSHFIECNRNALVRTNLAARTAYYTAGVNGGWLCANKILRIEGDEPIGPQGDIYRWPINMVPADQADMLAESQFAPEPVQSPPQPQDNSNDAMAANYRILAAHESKRLIQRLCSEAIRRSAKGGQAFVEFIESLPSHCQDPVPLRPLLAGVASRLSFELNRFTEPPYQANELKANVEAAIPQIQQVLMSEANERLERVA